MIGRKVALIAGPPSPESADWLVLPANALTVPEEDILKIWAPEAT
jgi:hypothetical protein